MSIGKYKINQFYGINQGVEENYLGNGYTADARNMNTDDGNLSVAKGFSHFVKLAIPDEQEVYRCTTFKEETGNTFIAVAGDSIYLSYGTAWLQMYTFRTALTDHDFGFLEAKIGTEDCLLIANGETGIVKFNGKHFTSFGDAEKCSDKPVRYLAMYKNRLFAAGDKDNPNRLYWSKLPGDGRTIDDWGVNESSVNVEGGHTEIGQFDSDPIVAITALSSQLLIFKRNSLYRLYGDRPSNFTVERIEAITECTPHTSVVHYGDIAFFMTKSGMYVFDGVSAHPMADSEAIKDILDKADFSQTKGARAKNKLYFTARLDDEDIIIEYNIKRQTYMVRSGFNVSDIFSCDDRLYIVSDRWVCLFDDGEDYAGQPIVAYWRTPLTDLDEKTIIKQLIEMYVRGDMSKRGTLKVKTLIGGITRVHSIRLIDKEVTQLPLCDEGRCFSVEFANESGGSFTLKGGVEIILSLRGRC